MPYGSHSVIQQILIENKGRPLFSNIKETTGEMNNLRSFTLVYSFQSQVNNNLQYSISNHEVHNVPHDGLYNLGLLI